ncbi:MAG TPA: thiamine phosphate synthase [Dyella sp.]|uniref:thiamine phosphate synthase n=1 Tax=Dyella sp. TaxID=1869338 RepID=UPI002D7943D5|nr:thiamine phosphate synthase [Dyella sp.]HET6555119.1 thiamine phosphate synthase [Dyella sp.]
MQSRLKGRGLYVITDGPRPNLLEVVALALAGGARLLQYRDKTQDHVRRLNEARAIRALCAARSVPMIVNDDVKLAEAVGAAGVHLGEDDGDIAAARELLGANAIIGASCYDSIERARKLADAGADYLAFGAFFPSPTKPHARRASFDLLRQSATLGLPRVAIGGITPDNGSLLIDAGADYLAVISAVFGDPDVRGAATRFTQLFTSY